MGEGRAHAGSRLADGEPNQMQLRELLQKVEKLRRISSWPLVVRLWRILQLQWQKSTERVRTKFFFKVLLL